MRAATGVGERGYGLRIEGRREDCERGDSKEIKQLGSGHGSKGAVQRATKGVYYSKKECGEALRELVRMRWRGKETTSVGRQSRDWLRRGGIHISLR